MVESMARKHQDQTEIFFSKTYLLYSLMHLEEGLSQQYLIIHSLLYTTLITNHFVHTVKELIYYCNFS